MRDCMKPPVLRCLIGMAAMGLAAGCQTTGSGGSAADAPAAYLMVETVPSGATLSFPDGTRCETPCPVDVTETMRMDVAKAGYERVAYTLYGNEPGHLLIELEEAAPTTDVEEVTLPDL